MVCVVLLLFPSQGVQISGLGTFTFTRQKLEVGNHKFILVQRPVFIMAEKLVQTHGLKQNKVFSPGKSFSQLRFSPEVCWPVETTGRVKLGQCCLSFWLQRLRSHMVLLQKGEPGWKS